MCITSNWRVYLCVKSGTCAHLLSPRHSTVLRVSSVRTIAADGEREEFQNIVAWTLASAVSTQGIIVNFEDLFIFHGSWTILHVLSI